MIVHFFHKIDKPIRKKETVDLEVLKYANLGFYLLIPIGSALTLGIVLDNVFQTRPVLVTVFLFLGTIATFYNLIRIIKDSNGKKYSPH